MNEINLVMVTKKVECESIKTRYTLVVDEPIFGMSTSARLWFIRRTKTFNMLNRLKRKI
jgi:hypothetical protein